MYNEGISIRSFDLELWVSALGRIAGVVNRITGKGLSTAATGLWKIYTDEHTLVPDDAERLIHRYEDRKLVLTWSFSGDVKRVIAKISVGDCGLRFSISIHKELPTKIRKLEYPIIAIRPADRKARLFIPESMGVEITEPHKVLTGRILELAYPAPLSMQFISYGEDGGGLLMFSGDSKGYVKAVRAYVEEDNLHLSLIHIPENLGYGKADFELPYPVYLRSFEGDWHGAAAVYKEWGTKQRWCHKGRLSERKDLPKKLRDVVLWVWNRGRSDNVIDPVKRISREFRKMGTTGLMWYWWHSNPYDVGMPEYLPPREGEEAFSRKIAELHRIEVPVILYLNARLWDMTGDGWSVARKFSCKGESRIPYEEHYNRFVDHPMAVMCPATSFWRQTLEDIVGRLIEKYGVDGVYLDQIAAATPRLCFDKSHGHPVGGGTYWLEGYRALLWRLKEDFGNDLILATEGCCEAYIDVVDMFLVLDNSSERFGRHEDMLDNWRPIPLFSYVYHEYVVTYGSYASLEDEPPYDELWPADKKPAPIAKVRYSKSLQFSLELSRLLSWGSVPTIHNLTVRALKDGSNAEDLDFLKEIISTFSRYRKFLLYGVMQQPQIRCADVQEIDAVKRSIYTPSDQIKVRKITAERVLHSTWRSEDATGLLLINYTYTPANVRAPSGTLAVPPRTVMFLAGSLPTQK